MIFIIDFIIKHKLKLLSVAIILVIIVLIIIMCIDLIPLMKNVAAHISNEKVVVSVINNYGLKGILILISLEALQIISVVFPAIPIQILAGLTFGIFYGLLICIAGSLIGNTIVFVLVRQLKLTFNFKFLTHEPKKSKSKWDFSFVRDAENVTMLAFLLFLIPGVPNGILPYIFANTKITLLRYLLCALTAGTPSIFLSILVGERIAKGDVFTAVLISGIVVFISIVVLLMRKRLIVFLEKRSNKSKVIEI